MGACSSPISMGIANMTLPSLLGLMVKHSELENRSGIKAQLVFHKQVLPPGACTIKLFTSVIVAIS
jgi:hypothetical protein